MISSSKMVFEEFNFLEVPKIKSMAQLREKSNDLLVLSKKIRVDLKRMSVLIIKPANQGFKIRTIMSK